MSLYTFYPTQAGGVALSFEAVELAGDAEAIARAAQIAPSHSTCARVVVWQGERLVHVHEETRASTPVVFLG